jgi:hypothetical protein
VEVENADALTSRKAPKPKITVRRNRNALLNSLANFNKGLGTKSSRNEIKNSSLVEDHNSSCDCALTPTGTVSDHFKNKSEFPFTVEDGRINVRITPQVRESAGRFKFREEEFPPL